MYEILLVEDDSTLSNGIKMALDCEQIKTTQSYSLLMAKKYLAHNHVSLVLLDINLPDGSGLELLGKTYSPVILLTANDTDADIVAGLELGADDYITKPFSLDVLRARVNTQLRKCVSAPASSFFKQGSFFFNFNTMEFFKDEIPIELSKTEQKLLKILVENKGLTVERGSLIDRIWTDGAEYVDENALSVSIKRLRDKLEQNPSKPDYIKTIYGIGYSWVVKKYE